MSHTWNKNQMPPDEMEFHLLCEKTKKPNTGILNEDINHMLWDSETHTTKDSLHLKKHEGLWSSNGCLSGGGTECCMHKSQKQLFQRLCQTEKKQNRNVPGVLLLLVSYKHNISSVNKCATNVLIKSNKRLRRWSHLESSGRHADVFSVDGNE